MKAIVEEVINNWDPLNLFPGAPKDEYKEEIDLITLLLKDTNDIHNIAHGIRNIFIKSFGDDIFNKNCDECFAIANFIIQKLQQM